MNAPSPLVGPLWERAYRKAQQARSGEGYASTSLVCGDIALTRPRAWRGPEMPSHARGEGAVSDSAALTDLAQSRVRKGALRRAHRFNLIS
ncbi:hypothetical protein BRAS3843_1100025 [Bradyrhizobium sp. STM 3843]|nr:hypothetical protein BRAS3843_1100025 [Bradyrhizobium sp. STM 3843]